MLAAVSLIDAALYLLLPLGGLAAVTFVVVVIASRVARVLERDEHDEA